jgi:adenylate cyclase
MAFNQMSRDLWIKSMMQESFGKYVGNEVLEMIMENPQSAWLKGKRSEATVLLVDIRGFTNYSDNNEPERVVGKLNEYFEITSNTVLKHGGYIDKFIGDAVLAVFGVPVYHGDHVKRAVYAAIDIQNNLKKIHKRKNPLLNSAGISINTGVVVSGNIGSQIKMEYTVIGDTVNVASRLNSLAGPGEIVLTQGIFDQLSDTIKVEKMPPQIIKGKKELIVIYKLISLKEK